MSSSRRTILTLFVAFVAWMMLIAPTVLLAHADAQGAGQTGAEKQVGTIQAISGNSITLATDGGTKIRVQVQDITRMVRVAPGQTDLKQAAAIHLEDLQVGDRILVRGQPSDDAKSIAAAVIIAMKSSDVQAKQEQERQDWQRRGVGGLVSAVDTSGGTITISFTAGGTKKSIVIHTTGATVFRRYAPDSVKFDDAKPSSIGEINPGDQLRARGSRNADTEFAAEEVVSGAFQNIAGTISSIDGGANTLSVKDLLSKTNVTVKISSDSQVRKLPPQMAQMIAMRLKGAGPGGGSNGTEGASAQQRPAAANAEGASRAGGFGANRPGGPPDFQQILSRMPAAGLADLQKGDAVMIVSTEGSGPGTVTAITLLAGVEPILQASPGMVLSPWSLGGSLGGDEAGGGSLR